MYKVKTIRDVHRWAESPRLFIHECLKTDVYQPQGRPIALSPIQHAWIDLIHNQPSPSYLPILAERQKGTTTIAVQYALWMMQFNPEAKIFVACWSNDSANAFIERIADFYQSNLSEAPFEPITSRTRMGISFGKAWCRAFATRHVPDSYNHLRGHSPSLLIMDNVQRDSNFRVTALPVVAATTRVVDIRSVDELDYQRTE